ASENSVGDAVGHPLVGEFFDGFGQGCVFVAAVPDRDVACIVGPFDRLVVSAVAVLADRVGAECVGGDVELVACVAFDPGEGHIPVVGDGLFDLGDQVGVEPGLPFAGDDLDRVLGIGLD